jgi:hypothetical protein
MTAYDIYNGTGSELTDVNGGGTDVPAGDRVDSVTLTTTELAAVLTNAGVAVLKNAGTATQLKGLIKPLVADAEGIAALTVYASGTYDIVNGTSTALTDVNAAGDDVPAYSIATAIALGPTELDLLGKTAGVILLKSGQTDAVKHKAVKVAKLGGFPSA